MSIIDRKPAIFGLLMKLRQVGRAQIGRLLGTVPTTSGKYKATIDLLERCYFMRAELNAIAGILIDKKIMTQEEWDKQIEQELRHYFAAVAKDWPELEFHDDGYSIVDVQGLAARAKREEWPT